MDCFESKQKILGTLNSKLKDGDLAEDFVEKIFSIGDKYSLTLGEVGKNLNILDKIISGDLKEENLLEELVKNLGVTEDEIADVYQHLEEWLELFKESEKIELFEEELETRRK